MSAVYGWAGTVIDLPTTTTRAIRFDPVPDSPNTWTAGGGTNLMWDSMSWILDITNSLTYADIGPTLSATNLTFETTVEKYYLYYSLVALETNPVDRVLYASSGASGGVSDRALSVGTPTRWTDANGCVWEMEQRLMGDLYFAEDSEFENKSGPYGFGEDSYVVPSGSGYVLWINDYGEMEGYPMSELSGHEGWWKEQRSYGTFFLKPSYEAVTNLITRVAYTNDTAPLAAAVTNLQVESALVYRLYSGSNVVAEVTNYNSQVHAPALRLMQLNESNEYVTVWTETNGLARTLRDASNYTDRAIADYAAPRAWSRTTSGLGADAPDGMTWVSTSNLVIAGGLEFEKHVTSGGAIWLLESNGMTADFHASNNNTAYLDISAADGTSIFRIEKTDSFLVGVNVNNVTVDGNTLVCGVNVVATEHPLVRVKARLTDANWAKEEDGIPASLATVAWSGTAGNWTCRITNNTGGGSLFAQMEYLQEGGTKIVNTAPLDVTPGILCTDGVHKVRPVYNNGNITWEVVP